MTSANVVYSIMSTLKEVDNAPSGVVYAALMTAGVSYPAYQGIISNLISAKLIRLVHNTLSLTDKGRELANLMDREVKPS